jgi:hypothetical protein
MDEPELGAVFGLLHEVSCETVPLVVNIQTDHLIVDKQPSLQYINEQFQERKKTRKTR